VNRHIDLASTRSIVTLYRASVAICSRERGDDHGATERQHSITYSAAGKADAFLAMRRFADRMLANMKCDGCLHWLGSVKLYLVTFGPLDDDGMPIDLGSPPFFEWKCDFPATLVDWFAAKELSRKKTEIVNTPRGRKRQ